MAYLQAALLGILQGLTEFLPVSSSAHLIIARWLLGWDGEQFGLSFDVALHVGTLAALVWFFRRELSALALATRTLSSSPPPLSSNLLGPVIVGTLPILVAGALYLPSVEVVLRRPSICAIALALGSVLLLWAEWKPGARAETSLTLGEGFAIGLAQAAALVPGVSRSGATISLAMLLGLNRQAAAQFAFLLGIPAVAAAGAFKATEFVPHDVTRELVFIFAVGVVSSGVVGYLTIKHFLRYLGNHSLRVFAGYRLLLSGLLVAWMVMG